MSGATPVEPRRQPSSWLRREWRLVVGLALSALCIVLAFRGVSLEALARILAAAKWQWIILAMGIVVAGTFLKTQRWRALFYPQRLGFGSTWAVFMVGQMLNAVLPARAGEIGRIYLIGEEEEVSRAKALSTVIVEKMVDLFMLALAYLVVAAWLSETPVGSQEWLQQAGRSVLPLAGAALLGLLLFAYAGRPTWLLLRRVVDPTALRWTSRADSAVEQAISGFEVLKRWQTSFQVWGLSFLIWMLAALTNVLIFNALQLSLSPYVALFLLVVLMSGVAVPPLPGNLGVFPFLCQLVLSLFGVDRETALVYGLTLQLVAYLPLIVIGSGAMLWENWSLRRSASASDQLTSDKLPN